MLSRPLKVGFEVNTSCNRRCNFCEPGNIVTDYYSRPSLSTEECLKIIDKLADNEIFEVFLTGGEPLLRKDLPKLAERCKDRGMIPSLSTNAEHINPDLARELEKAGYGLFGIQVSVEGPEDVNDKITKSVGGFRRSIKGIEALINEDIDVFISSVGTADVLSHIPRMLNWLVDNKINFSFYRVLRHMTFTPSSLKLQPTKESIEQVYSEISKMSRKNEFKVGLEYPAGILHPKQDSKYHQYYYICRAGKIGFDILHDGSVVPCKALKQPDFVVGNILKDDVEELWNRPIMKMFRELTPEKYKGYCYSCENKNTCYSCRAIAYNLTGDLFDDDISCYKLKEIHEAIH